MKCIILMLQNDNKIKLSPPAESFIRYIRVKHSTDGPLEGAKDRERFYHRIIKEN